MLKKHGDRNYEIARRKAAMAGARLMITEGISQNDAAKECNTNRSTISSALVVLNFGTEQEIAGAENGTLPLEPTAVKIRARTTPEERRAKRRRPIYSEQSVQDRQIETDVWQGLKSALDAITGLPSPKDTALIVRKNQPRLNHVNDKLLATLSWIQEFSNEITS